MDVFQQFIQIQKKSMHSFLIEKKIFKYLILIHLKDGIIFEKIHI